MRRIALLLLAALGAASGLAATAEPPLLLVRRLYGAFPAPSHTAVQVQPAQVLAGFFDPEMVQLFRRDAACVARSHGICNLDADPIWAVQDPEGARLEFASVRADSVQVTIRYPGDRKPHRLIYRLRRTEAGWRVRDIEDPSGDSLRRRLSR